MSEVIRSCITCAHRDGIECNLSGYCWRTQRKFPSVACDERLSGWVPIPPPPPPPPPKPRRSLRQWLYDTFWK